MADVRTPQYQPADVLPTGGSTLQGMLWGLILIASFVLLTVGLALPGV